jgi:hypothetical protein
MPEFFSFYPPQNKNGAFNARRHIKTHTGFLRGKIKMDGSPIRRPKIRLPKKRGREKKTTII